MTDIELRPTVCDALDFGPSVDAAHIGATAKDGVATLSGHVTTHAEKPNAAEIAPLGRALRAKLTVI